MTNRKVLTAFLNTYLEMRKQNTWNTWSGWLESWVSDVQYDKLSICLVVNKNFYDAPQFDLNTANGWINLLDDIGKKAEEQLVINGAFHAVRTYIIAKLLEDNPQDELHQTIRADFLKYIETLRKETGELNTRILKMVEDAAGKDDVKERTELYHNNLKRLANLGDKRAIAIAATLNLFPKMHCPVVKTDCAKLKAISEYVNSWNENIPWYMHPNWYAMFYELYYRKHLSATFESFEKQAMEGTRTSIDLPTENKSIFSFGFLRGTSTPPATASNPPPPPSFGQGGK